MSDNGTKIAKLAEYKDIEESLHAGCAPMYLFILSQMRTEHFDKLHALHTTLMTNAAKMLKEIYDLFPSFEELSDEEKAAFADQLTIKLEEDKQ